MRGVKSCERRTINFTNEVYRMNHKGECISKILLDHSENRVWLVFCEETPEGIYFLNLNSGSWHFLKEDGTDEDLHFIMKEPDKGIIEHFLMDSQIKNWIVLEENYKALMRRIMRKFAIKITSSEDKNAGFQIFIVKMVIVKKWVKAIKLFGALALAGSFYVTGYRIAGHISYVQDKAGIEAIKEQMSDREQHWSAVRLSTDSRNFLGKHLFGSWSFSRRLISLEECGQEGDFSSLAEKGLEDLWITFERDFISIKGYDADTFSNVYDVYLFSEYGGNTMPNQPVYQIQSDVDEENIILHHTLTEDMEVLIPFPEKCELMRITYDLGYDLDQFPAVDTVLFGDNIYLDPEDTDTIYMDFGGLWELKREGEQGSYSTAGKSKK